MNNRFPPDVDEKIRQQIATGDYANEDDVLRDALRSLADERDDWNAIQVGLRTLDEGHPGVSLDEAFREIRKRNDVADI